MINETFKRIPGFDSHCPWVQPWQQCIASLIGGPVSASQVISSAIMGVGAAERPNKVRWKIAQDIGITWILTIPAAALLAALAYKLLTRNLQ